MIDNSSISFTGTLVKASVKGEDGLFYFTVQSQIPGGKTEKVLVSLEGSSEFYATPGDKIGIFAGSRYYSKSCRELGCDYAVRIKRLNQVYVLSFYEGEEEASILPTI